MQRHLTNQQIEKLGNTLVYLVDNVGELTKTKALKLLFLLEESSVKKFANPFLGVDYELWQFGPVVKDVYIDLSEETPSLLREYLERDPNDKNLFKAKVNFSDDQFSDNDIYLLEKIRDFARHKTAKNLVDFTHEENSLWRKSALKYGVLQELENDETNYTNHLIDFSLLFEGNEERMERYLHAKENREFINQLKA